MLLPTVLCILIGYVSAIPQDDFRAGFEFDGYSTNLDDPKYRLLDNVYPHRVTVDLDVYLSNPNFGGVVTQEVEVRENLTQIVLHQNVVSIAGVNVLDSNNSPVALQFPDPFTTDSYYEILLINFANTVVPGNYSITIRYVGRINDNPVDRGFYRGFYYLNNQIRYYATTQFQPFHARKAFPCFDEPQFKSVYTISITRDSDLSPSYSNMAIAETVTVSTNRIRETFYPTPIISSYLVAFHVSDFVETNYTSTNARPFGIISRQGVLDQHPYAADIGIKITTELDDYFAIQYHQMGQGILMKNDHIALPDFPSGAMENWGMVNYREAYLLYDPDNTNIINKIYIATIMAHELAHKWFGNLVTCFWWSNLWLNESYASFFEFFAAHYADPSLELDEQFIVDYVHSALTSDASAGATPMNWTAVSNNPSISAHFSTTSYAKGASVLKMMEHFVGERNFRIALRYYLRDNAYEIGTPEDMYNGFRQAVTEDFEFVREYPNIDVGEVFDSWVQNAGAPVVNVDVNMDTGVISLTQERFQLTGTPEEQLWHIPITWTHSGNLNFSSTKPSFIMSTRTTTIQNTAGHNFVILNIAQSGLYRVMYDDHNWEMIAAYLRTNRENIHKMNRAQIVNDVLFFIRAGKITISRAFDVLAFLEQETDYYVWAGALTQLDWIRRRLEVMPRVHALFSDYMARLMERAIQHLGYDERTTDSTSTILNRMQIMNYACNLGHAGCVSDSLAKWRNFRNNDTNLVPVNLRRYVYCIGLREGNASDYQFLFQKYNTSENTADMVVMLRALACTKDQASLQHYLDQSMYNDRIRIHDKTNAFTYALQGNPENLRIVLDFVYQNYALMRRTYGGGARLTVAINQFATFLTDFATIREFKAWVYSNQIQLEDSFASGVSVVNTAMANLQWGSDMALDIFNTIAERSSAGSITASLSLLITAVVMQMFR